MKPRNPLNAVTLRLKVRGRPGLENYVWMTINFGPGSTTPTFTFKAP